MGRLFQASIPHLLRVWNRQTCATRVPAGKKGVFNHRRQQWLSPTVGLEPTPSRMRSRWHLGGRQGSLSRLSGRHNRRSRRSKDLLEPPARPLDTRIESLIDAGWQVPCRVQRPQGLLETLAWPFSNRFAEFFWRGCWGGISLLSKVFHATLQTSKTPMSWRQRGGPPWRPTKCLCRDWLLQQHPALWYQLLPTPEDFS